MRQTYFNKPVRRPGLTLVELLVSISLITVVSSMFLVAYRAAATEASNIRTQSTIRKISEVLVSRMQEYENYPIQFARSPGNAFAIPVPGNAVPALPSTADEYEPKGILLERLRVMLLREMIAQEMPDHYQDIKLSAPIVKNYWTGLVAVGPNANAGPQPVVVTASESPRAARLKARLNQANPNWASKIELLYQTNTPQSSRELKQELTRSNAEFLYLIVEDSILNGSPAIELFGKSEIGDTDGDGLLEFLDSFRQPICWVRWPTGFPETTRFHPDLLDPSFNINGFANYAFSDPLDPRKADPGYRIKSQSTKVYKPSAMAFPLVISSGPDQDADGAYGFGVKLWHERGFIPVPNEPYRIRGQEGNIPPSGSTTDVIMPVPYDNGGGASRVMMCDPWFPRKVDPNIPLTIGSYRLGAIPDPTVDKSFVEQFKDDITNYSINGAYQ